MPESRRFARARRVGALYLGRYPGIYLPLARRRYGDLAFGHSTQLVIEGFPRSANTFAATAFFLSQPDPVIVAHHLHAPAQIIAACRSHVPAIVLVRDPVEAICSFILRHPDVHPRFAAKQYLDFYNRVWSFRQGFLTADFNQVTADFGAVIRRVNHQFDQHFEEFEHTPSNVADCFSHIERASTERRGGLFEHIVARPSLEKAGARDRARKDVFARTDADLRLNLQRAYHRFLELSERSAAA